MRKLTFALVMCGLFPLCAEAQNEEVLKQLRTKFDVVYMMPGDDMILINKGMQVGSSGGSTGKFGYADMLGQVVIPPQYDAASRFHNGFVVVGTGKPLAYKYGLIDRRGRVVVPLEWDGLRNVNDGVAVAFTNNNGKHTYSLIDTLGRVKPLEYQRCNDFSNGLALVGSGVFREVEVKQEGLTHRAETEFEGKYGYITPDGKLAIPCRFTEADSFTSDGLAAVGIQGKYYVKWGFIDKSGAVIIPCDYFSVDVFSEGLSMVGKVAPTGDVIFGYVDAKGTEVIPCCFNEATRFSFANTWVGVNKNGMMTYQLINKEGNAILPNAVYNLQDGGKYGQAVAAYPNSEGRLLYGILGITGKVLLPFEYDEITIFSERDPDTGQWQEAAMATKDGEGYSFDISRKKPQ